MMFKTVAVFGLLLLSISSKIFAACSPFVGGATLNEILKSGGNNGEAFIEVELLNTAIPASTYQNWYIKICHSEKNQPSSCEGISLANFNVQAPWFWVESPDIDRDYIDFKNGFDLSLLDENGLFIDYIQIHGYSGQNFTDSCSYDDLSYVFPIPSDIQGGTKILLRKPDGTGEWLESKNLNEYPPTPGEGNDGNPSVIDHFEIIHDGQGLTCEAEPITIKACADASCSTLIVDATDVLLSVNGQANKTVTVLGSTNTTFSHTTAGTAILSLDQTHECVNGASSSCDVLFSDSGFRFFSDVEGNPIPEQLSAKPSNIGFKASSLIVQAVEKNTNTGACQAALIDIVNIEMSATCADPVNCAGSQVNINNTVTDTLINTVNSSDLITYTSVGLDFGNDTQNTAEFTFSYPDAGKVQLHARYNIPDENGDLSGNYMFGSSNAFVVRPLGFYVDIVNNPKAQSALGNKFIAAGEDFSTQLTAIQWQAVDDVNQDGVPDSNANLSDNAPTPNFGNEIAPETAQINGAIYLPSSISPGTGVNGNLTNVVFTNFIQGIATNNMTYSEVGIVNFQANLVDNSYINTSDIIGVEPYVGRFIPHHFELTVGLEGEFSSVCDITTPSSTMSFAYIGQMSSEFSGKGALQYLFQPEVIITPQTKQNTHTRNYIEGFNKLLLSGVKRFEVDDGSGALVLAPVVDTTQKGIDDINKMRLTASLSDGLLTETAGVLSFEYSVADHFVYIREQNAEITPFITDINLSLVSVIDQDDVSANDADDLGDTGNASDTVITLNPVGIEMRFGRFELEHSFGPETSDLPQPFSVHYLKTQQQGQKIYVINEQDTCTNFNTTNIVLTSGTLNENSTSINVASGQFDDVAPNGETRSMILSAPGQNRQGTINVEYISYPWLKYDWNWNGVEVKVFDENPRAVATFGLFRGNDRVIYNREINL